MKTSITALLFAAALSLPAAAEEKRGLDAHEHGVGKLNIAIEGNTIAMELEAPGADIVGFEHPATTAEDRSKVDGAIAMLAKPQELFVLPAEAACLVSDAHVSLVTEEEHGDDHGEEKRAHEDHKVEDAEEKHAHEDHKDEHAEEKHAGHDDHEDEAGHTEFHAGYMLNCEKPEAVARIEFPYFTVFGNARELEVQMISDRGTEGHEVERDNPVLDLSGQS